MTVFAYVKDPDAISEYTIDWAAEGLNDDIVTSTWVPDDEDIVVESDDNTVTTTTVQLSGGTANVEYLIVNHVVTQSGLADDRTILVRCLQR